MSWDDIHESNGPQDRPNPGGGKSGGPRGPQFEFPQINLPKFKPSLLVSAGILLLVVWILPSTFYFVEPDEAGVVTRFGIYARTTDSGLHFKLPSPIEHVTTPKTRKVRRMEIGFRVIDQGPPQKIREVPAESLMLTGDENIVDINLVIQYTVIDPVAYEFNIRQKQKLIMDVGEAVIRGIVGKKKIDEALTTGKAEIQAMVLEQTQALLNRYASGVRVVTIQLQDVHPPSQVAAAFKDVVSAREDKERMINEAQGYRNGVIPEARGKAAQVVREAEAYREEKIKMARGDAERFLAQYEEYRKAPGITRRRIYLETMEEVLPNMQKYLVNDKKGGIIPLLQLGKIAPIPQTPSAQNAQK
ncbi:MAG: HflK protein [Nitrospinae bacterium RIFCSPLOWO2_12_FULL_47_7]|nr:MAG: HflK protein [Nitrospinae bacterium RIFCSPLOWO2_12_FULL_47_7]